MALEITVGRYEAGSIVSAPLAGAAYPKGFTGEPQYHAVELGTDETPVRVLCRKVRLEHVLDDSTQFDRHDISCKTCLTKARRELQAKGARFS